MYVRQRAKWISCKLWDLDSIPSGSNEHYYKRDDIEFFILQKTQHNFSCSVPYILLFIAGNFIPLTEIIEYITTYMNIYVPFSLSRIIFNVFNIEFSVGLYVLIPLYVSFPLTTHFY